MIFKNPERQIANWIKVLSSYDMKIEHRSGKSHQNAHGVSRIPCTQCSKSQGDNTIKVNMIDQSDPEMLDLKTLQEEDKDISLIREWVDKGEKPDSKDKASESYFVKTLIGHWPKIKIHGGLLTRKYEVPDTGMVAWQVVVPQSQRRLVLKFSHDLKSSGHLGIKKTLSKARQNYYWPGFEQDTKINVLGCETCQSLFLQKERPCKWLEATIQ